MTIKNDEFTYKVVLSVILAVLLKYLISKESTILIDIFLRAKYMGSKGKGLSHRVIDKW